ncbi:hypothetical protein QCA50_011938 [Cerrena zonata]|uniref:F-box domain-containing protein n=1 Tax=Cerrena zonata TaxID=2478898 RepID=A0AAW0FW27_9APHY
MANLSYMIPPELSDYTIDFLHDDIPSLRACALTCRSWLLASRFHLFDTVRVHSAQDLDKLVALVSSTNGHSQDIVSCIQTLSVSKASPASTSPHTTDRSLAHWEASLPTVLSPQLPYLSSLHIDSFLSFWQPSSFSLSSFSQFTSVRNVHLSNSSLKSFQDLRSLLGKLPQVDDLWLDNVTFGNEQIFSNSYLLGLADDQPEGQERTGNSPLASGTSTPRPWLGINTHPAYDLVSLTSLRIDRNPKPIAVLLGWLLTTPSVQTLRNIAFSALENHDLDAVNTFLGVVGGSLESLTVGLKEGTAIGTDLPLTFMSRLSLTSLTFTSLSSTSPITNAWVLPFLTRFIKDASNPVPLKFVAFECTSGTGVEAEASLDLSALCNLLKSSSYIPRLIFRGVRPTKTTNGTPMWKEISARLAHWTGTVTFD